MNAGEPELNVRHLPDALQVDIANGVCDFLKSEIVQWAPVIKTIGVDVL